jgi:GntR family transcriptional regulator
VDSFERRTPHYLRIYRHLKAQVVEGVFAPNVRLPSQRELAASHGVTVMTVRQALQLLEQEEIVVSRHGLGTFVAPQRIRYALGNLRSFAQEMADQGLEPETRVLRDELIEPHPRVVELLRLEPGDPVLLIERLRLVGGEPVALQQSHLQSWLSDPLAELDLSVVSIYTCLQTELGIELAHAQERIHAIALGAREATLLGEKPEAAALLSERVTFSAAAAPLMLDLAYLPGDRVSVATERFVSDVTVGFELRLGEEEGRMA